MWATPKPLGFPCSALHMLNLASRSSLEEKLEGDLTNFGSSSKETGSLVGKQAGGVLEPSRIRFELLSSCPFSRHIILTPRSLGCRWPDTGVLSWCAKPVNHPEPLFPAYILTSSLRSSPLSTSPRTKFSHIAFLHKISRPLYLHSYLRNFPFTHFHSSKLDPTLLLASFIFLSLLLSSRRHRTLRLVGFVSRPNNHHQVRQNLSDPQSEVVKLSISYRGTNNPTQSQDV